MANKKILNQNKEGLFDYQALEIFQAGIVLTGPEVKSVKNSQISLKGSYISIDRENQAWLVNCHVAGYKPAQNVQQKYEPEHRRKLLLHKKEIVSMLVKSKQKGLTIIPTCVYTINGLVKLDIAIARGKTAIDKRENIKKREVEREIRSSLKKNMRV